MLRSIENNTVNTGIAVGSVQHRHKRMQSKCWFRMVVTVMGGVLQIRTRRRATHAWQSIRSSIFSNANW